MKDINEVNLYKIPWKGLKLLVLTLPFVAVGIWLLWKGEMNMTGYFIAWLCTGFFGLGIPIGLYQTFDRRPQNIIDETGIWDRTTQQDQVKWEQIKDAYHVDVNQQKFVALVVDDTFVFRKKPYKWASKLNAIAGAQDVNLHLSQLKIQPQKMTAFIQEMIAAEPEKRKSVIKAYFHV